MQYASAGQWGKGIYFARDAGYSHIYAKKHENGEREFILASLLLGRVVPMDRVLIFNIFSPRFIVPLPLVSRVLAITWCKCLNRTSQMSSGPCASR